MNLLRTYATANSFRWSLPCFQCINAFLFYHLCVSVECYCLCRSIWNLVFFQGVILYPNRNSPVFHVRRWKLLLTVLFGYASNMGFRLLTSLLRIEILINYYIYRLFLNLGFITSALFVSVRMFFLWYDLHYNILQKSQLVPESYLFKTGLHRTKKIIA